MTISNVVNELEKLNNKPLTDLTKGDILRKKQLISKIDEFSRK